MLYWTDQFVRRSLFHINAELIQVRGIVPNPPFIQPFHFIFVFLVKVELAAALVSAFQRNRLLLIKNAISCVSLVTV